MTVLLTQRKESELKVISYAYDINSMLIKLMQRGLGIKDFNKIIRALYMTKPNVPNNVENCEYLISEYKRNINHHASKLINDLNSANSIYPTMLSEFELRRSYQDNAIVDCTSIKTIFNQIVEVFDVDINIYREYVEALNKEIHLIKRWRQSNNKFKRRLLG